METYHTKNRDYLSKRRLLSYHSKGFDKDFIKTLEEKNGLDGAINELKKIKLQIKNDEKPLTKKALINEKLNYIIKI